VTSADPALDRVLEALHAVRAAHPDRPVLVAVDGRSGVGKSTLCARLAARAGAAHVDGDDFYAGGDAAALAALAPPERAAAVIDVHRLRTEALQPLLAGRTARWRAFDWDAMAGLAAEPTACEPGPVVVLDGTYSGRPELADLVDLSVLVTLDDRERLARLAAREGDDLDDAELALWEAAEDHYFAVVRPPASFDLVVAG
jgi:para-aminobenzoate synthetase